jgi:predicted protein tyrosine phosphatase
VAATGLSARTAATAGSTAAQETTGNSNRNDNTSLRAEVPTEITGTDTPNSRVLEITETLLKKRFKINSTRQGYWGVADPIHRQTKAARMLATQG